MLAANPCARALSPGFMPGQNFLRWRLLDPAARELFVDWDEATEIGVCGLREAAGGDTDDPRLSVLIDELSAASDRFRELWHVRMSVIAPAFSTFATPWLATFTYTGTSSAFPTRVGSNC